MFCSECGSELTDGVQFCSKCGTAINKPAQAQDNINPKTNKKKTGHLFPGDSGKSEIVTIIISGIAVIFLVIASLIYGQYQGFVRCIPFLFFLFLAIPSLIKKKKKQGVK